MDFKLSNRLAAVASFVRQDSVIADIGTDHALLPIWLVKNKIAQRAFASDINEGPLQIALGNIEKLANRNVDFKKDGADKIMLALAAGLSGIESFAPDDIIIAGMGGELISDIIEENEYAKRKNVRLILQPMTKADKLRGYLLESGFNIIEEALAEEDGKIFQVICCEFDGVLRSHSPIELLVGRINLLNGGPIVIKLLVLISDIIKKRVEGKRRADLLEIEDILEDERILCEISSYLKSLNN